MRAEKLVHGLAAMPAGPIDIEPDGLVPEPSIQMPQDQEKAGPIPACGVDQSQAPQQGGHPARDIEPLPMLAGRRNPEALPPAGPAPAQPGMLGKAGLILEDHRLVGAQGVQFFLMPAESAGHRRPWLGDRHGWPA